MGENEFWMLCINWMHCDPIHHIINITWRDVVPWATCSVWSTILRIRRLIVNDIGHGVDADPPRPAIRTNVSRRHATEQWSRRPDRRDAYAGRKGRFVIVMLPGRRLLMLLRWLLAVLHSGCCPEAARNKVAAAVAAAAVIAVRRTA
jgi:hypothetical protein